MHTGWALFLLFCIKLCSATTPVIPTCTGCPPAVIIIEASTSSASRCCDPLCHQCIGGIPPLVSATCTGEYCPCKGCVCCYTSTVYVATTTTCVEHFTTISTNISTWTVNYFVNELLTTTFTFTFTQRDTRVYTDTETITETVDNTSVSTSTTVETSIQVSTFFLTTSTLIENSISSVTVLSETLPDIFESTAVITITAIDDTVPSDLAMQTIYFTVFDGTTIVSSSFLGATETSVNTNLITTDSASISVTDAATASIPFADVAYATSEVFDTLTVDLTASDFTDITDGTTTSFETSTIVVTGDTVTTDSGFSTQLTTTNVNVIFDQITITVTTTDVVAILVATLDETVTPDLSTSFVTISATETSFSTFAEN